MKNIYYNPHFLCYQTQRNDEERLKIHNN